MTVAEEKHVPDPHVELGPPGPVNPGSKGCGTVMRSAPFGLTRAPAETATPRAQPTRPTDSAAQFG